MNIETTYGIRLVNQPAKLKIDLCTNIPRSNPLNDTPSGKFLLLRGLEMEVVGEACNIITSLFSVNKPEYSSEKDDYDRAKKLIGQWLYVHFGPLEEVPKDKDIVSAERVVGNNAFKDCFFVYHFRTTIGSAPSLFDLGDACSRFLEQFGVKIAKDEFSELVSVWKTEHVSNPSKRSKLLLADYIIRNYFQRESIVS